ncbi:glycosyl hydrolase family 18 protein [Capsulimonas corticalis]|uniref:glycosyl hydrolase family 18 protein n=1 Tax=Capsulimonas corticalis TaxID=2219043 RepID=UPI000F652B85|nr:glycosyl hydrolase family 18 protein [Capsulimonas corticalis]
MKINHIVRVSLALSALLAAVAPSAMAKPAILGYYTADGGSDNSLVSYPKSFNQMSADTFKLSSTGTVSGDVPIKALARAKSLHIATYACLSNFGKTDFEPAIVHAVITSPAATAQMISDTLALLRANHFKGVNIDLEGVPNTDRAAFCAFVHKVSSSMRAAGFKTVISVPAQTKDDPTNSWNGAFNLSSIGKDVDIVQFMAYDQHGPWSAPGPVASIDWVTEATHYAVSVVPPSKLSLGLAAYGYDWNLTKKTGTSIPWNGINAVVQSNHATPQRDAVSGSPNFTYTVNGDSHIVWYEDPASIQQKAKLASSTKLGGVSVWALGREDATFWQAVGTGMRTGGAAN